MHVRSPKPTGNRTSAVFHTVWITTAALVLFDVTSDKSTIKSFFAPRSISEIVVNQFESMRAFGNKPHDAVQAAPSPAHGYFGLDDSPAEVEPADKPTEAIDLRGQWTGAVDALNVGTLWRTGDCDYEIRSLDFQLRSSGPDVYGNGSYSLRSNKCPEGELVTHHRSVTGKISHPFLKLNVKNSESGQTEIVYYGTVRPEGIVGQVRSGYGELLAEHVTLVRR